MKTGSKKTDFEKLASQLDQLRRLNAEELIKRWQALFGVAPPKKLRASLLVQGLAYRLQEKALGGLKPSTLRLLDRIADDTAAGRPIRSEKVRMTIGTVLMREWHGKKHQVIVLDDGFLYRTKHFRSLSQIARLITGARWSGPLFFGLKSSRKEQTNEAA